MAGKLGKYQMQGFQHWKGLTRENHLGSIFQSAPQKATNLMVQLLASYKGKTLETFLSQFPTKMFDTDDEYTWEICLSTGSYVIKLIDSHNNGWSSTSFLTEEEIEEAGRFVVSIDTGGNGRFAITSPFKLFVSKKEFCINGFMLPPVEGGIEDGYGFVESKVID